MIILKKMILRIKNHKLYKYIILIILLFTLLVVYKFRHRIKHEINLYVKQNIIVKLPSGIDKNDIRIIWNGNPSYQPITFDGENNWSKVPLARGNNCFSVFYKDSIINTVGHFKISNSNYNNYLFNFFKCSNRVCFDFKVLGADSLNVKKWEGFYHWTKALSNSYQRNPPLALLSSNNTIKNIIEFKIDNLDYQKLKNTNSDVKIKNTVCLINAETHDVKSIKTRGRSSMSFRRKSFNVNLEDSLNLSDYQGGTGMLKSFSLLSLSMDHYYFRYRTVLELFNELLHNDIKYTFSELKINSQTQGIYLIVENPKKYLFDSKQAGFILRRGYECSSRSTRGNIDNASLDYRSSKNLKSKDVDYSLDQYKNIYRLITYKKGKELYRSLDSIINIEEYMKIMAFNFVICNGDYTDELFFYKSSQDVTKRFNFLPWDFDDIFVNSPHEGWELRNNQINNNKLIFSVENDLDLAIAKEPFLYQKYLKELNKVINTLDTLYLKGLYEETYNELYPYYLNNEIMKQSKFDLYKTKYSITNLENQLNGTYMFFMKRIQTIRTQLKMEMIIQ